MLLEESVCLVTGASRGIGASIATRFAEEGATVYANARSEGSLDALCESNAGRRKGTIVPVYFDVCDAAGQKAAIMQIKKEQGRLDVLVNNAGIMKDSLIGMIDRSTVQATFETNVFSAIELMQLATKLMFRQGSGSVINMSSLVGVNGNRGQAVYAASKGAVISLTKAAAKELAPKGIRVNAVAPGMIDTDLFRSAGEEAVERFSSCIGMGRVGAPEDVADVCVFLASDLSRYVTGQVIGVDGSALM
ncbi:SDR family NAD(P)-dependent oxidoreductase [Raoultibacter timonensis]|uniref:3-oxoacyl-[acyl-carrier-protein] reductase FabG n=1 Tax=Raoultibacter timonensis TaxID=1907662 RepID=A0ABN6ME15_9ACTN|nr:SDR family NAD(P)-dependent oxidoreductase [Raoultibacter timonensis]BDE96225.1 3-oxoacyl-[acyl-carrier-protein] reductase FabG [Raoultibacter timonensis]BDF50830.1 3-oxoacyl-[acyl-carrier-protein] reductase FabG [Raoultibacter timonensis]